MGSNPTIFSGRVSSGKLERPKAIQYPKYRYHYYNRRIVFDGALPLKNADNRDIHLGYNLYDNLLNRKKLVGFGHLSWVLRMFVLLSGTKPRPIHRSIRQINRYIELLIPYKYIYLDIQKGLCLLDATDVICLRHFKYKIFKIYLFIKL